jgi:hypothetical protein
MSSTWDPFTAAHQAIFAALQNYAPLAAVVLPGNFVDTTDPLFQQFKPGITAGDTPQVQILQDEFVLPPFGGSSTTVQFTQSYRVFFCTDVLQVVPLNQLKYLSLIALVKAGPTLGLTYVKSYEVKTGRDDCGLGKTPSSSIQSQLQNSQRWAAAFVINVEMYLSRQQLAAS